MTTHADASAVLRTPAADPALAAAHFAARLAVETDCADVAADLAAGAGGFVLADARSAADYAAGHLPGAVSLPHRDITAAGTAGLPADATVVVYCWGPSCNAAGKAAVRLAGLGFRVKEMLGGFEYWCREGHPMER